MALKEYVVRGPDGEVIGKFKADETATPEQLQAGGKQAYEQLMAKRVERLSKVDARQIKCSICDSLMDRGREFNDHMEKHNQELNLGESIE